MKSIGDKFIAYLHYFILLYAAFTVWTAFEEHTTRMTELEDQFPAIQAEITKNQKKVREIQDFAKKAEESKIRVEEVAKNIESAQRQLPSEINDNQIFTFFSEEINSLNIKDPKIIPGTEETSTYYISKEYKVSAKGTFLQFLVFFERIGNATRIYNVKSLKLTNNDTNQRGRFQMISAEGVIQAFRYNPDFRVDRGFETVEAPKE